MITVLMAVWQGADYLAEQLDSIIAQTKPVDRIVISDDGSTDETLEIITQYRDAYPGLIELLHHGAYRGYETTEETLTGAAANFFYLLQVEARRSGSVLSDTEVSEMTASGTAIPDVEPDYWFLSDQDDIWLPDKVARMVEQMQMTEHEVGTERPVLLYSDVKVVDRNKNVLSGSLFEYQRMDPERVEFPEILVENPVTGGAAMFNRRLLEFLGEAPENCVMHDWWLALTASCFGMIVCLPEPLGLYRQHGCNTMGANRTGSLQDLRKRLKRGDEVRENYRMMFAQAECFLLRYGQVMSAENRQALQGFLSLAVRNPIRRFGVIRKHSLYKSSLLQTLAQCFTIKR